MCRESIMREIRRAAGELVSAVDAHDIDAVMARTEELRVLLTAANEPRVGPLSTVEGLYESQ